MDASDANETLAIRRDESSNVTIRVVASKNGRVGLLDLLWPHMNNDAILKVECAIDCSPTLECARAPRPVDIDVRVSTVGDLCSWLTRLLTSCGVERKDVETVTKEVFGSTAGKVGSKTAANVSSSAPQPPTKRWSMRLESLPSLFDVRPARVSENVRLLQKGIGERHAVRTDNHVVDLVSWRVDDELSQAVCAVASDPVLRVAVDECL